MKNKLKKISLALVAALCFCCAVIWGALLIFDKEGAESPAEAVATTTTVTFVADKTDIIAGDTVTLTITVASTRGTAEWNSINIYAGPLKGDNKTMNADICKYLKVTTKRTSFSPADYNNLSTDKFAAGTGAFLCVSCSYLGEIEIASTNCVFTLGIKIADDAPNLGSFVFGMNPTAANNATYNDGAITDKASTGAFAATNSITFNMGAPSDDATLSSVSVGHGSASAPLTVADNMSYTSTNATQSNFKVRPVATDAGATITIGKDTEDPTTAVNSGSEATVPLSGGVTNITIKVTAADKTTVKRYHLTVTCGYVQISALTATTNSLTTGATKNGLDGSYSTSKSSYKVYVPSDATTVNIACTVAANYGISTTIGLLKTGGLTIPSTNTATSGTAFAVQNVSTGDTLTLTATAADGATTAIVNLSFEKVNVNTNIKTFTMTGKGQSVKYYNDTAQTSSSVDYYFELPHSCDYSGTFDIELEETTSTVKVGTAAYNPATIYGSGTYNVTVTAQAGNSRTYRVNVVKIIVPAEFTSLKFSQNGTDFTDVFTAGEYNSATRTFTKKINVTAFGGSTPQIYIGGTTTPDATVTASSGLKTNSSTASGEAKNYYATLSIGKNSFTLQAASATGNMVYTFVIDYVEELNSITAMTIKNAANNTDVSGFTFSSATTSYSVSVPYKTTSVTIAAVTDGRYAVVLNDAGAKISRNNSTRTHTTTRALNVGDNTVKLHAVADEGDGAAGTEYTLTITRQPAETNSKLSGLVVKEKNASGAVLPFTDADGNPVTFDPDVLNYNIVLPEDHSGVLNVFIDAPVAGAEASVSGAGAVSLGTIAAGVDNAKVLPITVTAEDGTKTTYRVIISQKAIVLDDSIELSELVITGNDGNVYFTSAVAGLTYGNYPAITVPFLVERVNVSATTVSSKATLHGTGVHELTVIGGSGNKIEVWVSAEDGTNGSGAQKYVFTIIREKAAEHAWLTDLQVNGVTLSGFHSEKFTYSLREPSSSERVSLNAVAEEERAKITMSVGGTVVCSDFGTAYAAAVALGGKGQIIVITINVALDDVTTPYTLNIARASDKPYLTSLNVGGLDIRDVDGNIIDGYDESVVSVMEDFYVEIVYSTVGSIIIQATANDASAELRLPGDNGELSFSSLFGEDGSTSSVQIAVIPIVGEVAVYYVHFTSLTSSTLAEINIKEISKFNESYTDDRTVYGIYQIGYELSELITSVNFQSQAGYGVGTYQIFYNDVLKNDNGKEVQGVYLDYGFNYISIQLVSSDKRAKKTVVVLVERELPYFESISIEEISGFAGEYQKDRTEYFYQVEEGVKALHFTVELSGNYRYVVENATELKAGLNQVRVCIYERDGANANTRVANAETSPVRVISIHVFRAEAGASSIWTIVFYGLIALCVLLLLLLIIVAMRKKTVVQPAAVAPAAAPIIVTAAPAPYIVPQQHEGVAPIIVTPAQYVQQPVAGQPVVQQPIVQPVIQQPVQPIVQPVIQQPVQPVQQVVQQPVVQQPVQQVVQQPVVQQPVQQVVQQPAAQPAQQAAPVQNVAQPAQAQPQDPPFVMPQHLDKSQFVEPQFMQTSPLPQFIETEGVQPNEAGKQNKQ